jgi:hypothetical protein
MATKDNKFVNKAIFTGVMTLPHLDATSSGLGHFKHFGVENLKFSQYFGLL